MRYRSAVALALTSKGANILQARLETLDEDSYVRKETEDLLRTADQHYTDAVSGAEVFYWENIKWYHEFEEVRLVVKCIEYLDDDDYRFIRIGEDVDDIVCAGSFYDDPFAMDLSRRINIDKPDALAPSTPQPVFSR